MSAAASRAPVAAGAAGPAAGTPARGPCPCCSGRTFEPTFAAEGRRFERCPACGYQRMADPPPEDAMDGFYRASRAHGEEAYGEHERNLVRFARILERIERWVRPGLLLDVGCSVGTSLVAAARRGWRAIGLELSRPVAEFAREEWGLDVRTETLEERTLPARSFDAVLFHHTLEHLRRPARAVSEAARLLKPGGVAYVAVPNHASLKARLLGAHFGYGVTPEHISHFTPACLALLLKRRGLIPVGRWTQSYAADPRFLLDLCRRIGTLNFLYRWCGSERDAFDQEAYVRLITDDPIAHFVSNRLWPAGLVALLGLGEDLHVVARHEPWRRAAPARNGSFGEEP